MGTSTGTIHQYKQFLKNNNMIRQIGHHYNTGITQMSNATSTNYFTTFLQNVDMTKLLLVFI